MDVEVGSRGSEWTSLTFDVRFLRARCPTLDVGGEAIGEFLRSGPLRFALATGSGGQRAHQVRYVQPRAVTDESVAALHCGKTSSCSWVTLVIAFARGREESIMTFTIHASKDGHLVQTLRLKPQAAVSKARSLNKAGWEVHITNSQGASFSPPMFGELLQSRDDASLAPDRATLVALSDDTTESAMLS